jgi:hypothetical protein
LELAQRSHGGGNVDRTSRAQRSKQPGIRLFVAAYPGAEALDCMSERLAVLDLPDHRL